MPKVAVTHKDEAPMRLFQSNFLEFFTHIHPAVIVIIWLPVALYFLLRPIIVPMAGVSAWYIPAGFVLGLILWTLAEYLLHRFVFHFHAKSKRGKRITFLFHGVHHAQPQDKTRLVMPPVVSIPLALLFYGLFHLVWSVLLKLPHWVAPTFSGFIAGYLVYDLTHYATHHFAMRDGWWKYIKRYHMQHHYTTPDARYGVSSPLWDMVFGTMPK